MISNMNISNYFEILIKNYTSAISFILTKIIAEISSGEKVFISPLYSA